VPGQRPRIDTGDRGDARVPEEAGQLGAVVEDGVFTKR